MECLHQNRGISTAAAAATTTTTTTTAPWGTRISSLGHGRVKVTAVHAVLGGPQTRRRSLQEYIAKGLVA